MMTFKGNSRRGQCKLGVRTVPVHIQGEQWSGRGAQAAFPGTGPKWNHCNVGSNVRMASAPSTVATFLDDYRPGHKVLR